MTKSIILHPFLTVEGGSERITLEEERFLRLNDFDVTIITFEYKDIYDHAYQPQVKVMQSKNKNLISKVISRIRQLRSLVKEINPDVIDVCNSEGCLYMYFATLFTEYKYFTQIPSSGLDNIDKFGEHLVSYSISSRIFKSGYKKIRLSSIGHYQNLPEKILYKGIVVHLFSDLLGFLMYKAVRKAQNIFVLSKQVKWELEQLYHKDAIVLRGAYRKDIFKYKPLFDLRKKLGIMENKKIILSLCRLVPKKRVDWIIKAFGTLVRQGVNDIILIVGGTGPSADELKILATDLGVEEKVIFTGFINDQELYDYYYHCDVFVSADYADFDITTYMAIAFDKNIVWTIDNELVPELERSGKIFPADLNPEGIYSSLKQGLVENSRTRTYGDVDYSWEKYFATIYDSVLKSS